MNLLLLLEISFFGLFGLVSFAIAGSFIYYFFKSKKKSLTGTLAPETSGSTLEVVKTNKDTDLPEHNVPRVSQEWITGDRTNGERIAQGRTTREKTAPGILTQETAVLRVITQGSAILASPAVGVSEPRFVVVNPQQSPLRGEKKPQYAELIKFR